MRVLPPLLLSAALMACGARSELALPAADASLPAACAWSSSAPLVITLGDRDRSPLAARVLDDRLWVGFPSSNPDPPGNLGRFGRRTDALGRPVADATEVLPSHGELTTYGPLSLWTAPATRAHAAMSRTEGGGCASPADPTRPAPRGRGY